MMMHPKMTTAPHMLNPALTKPKQKERRPLIGVPTWSDHSQAYSCVAVYAMNRLYIEAIKRAGGLPILIPLDLDEDGLETIFEQLDGLFLAGGEDIAQEKYTQVAKAPMRPDVLGSDSVDSDSFDRDTTELLLTRRALAARIPILGICRGMQLINVATGGTLYEDLDDQRPDLCKHNYFGPRFARDRMSHGVELAKNSLLADLFGSYADVNSLHHQGIAHVGDGLKVIAWSTNTQSTNGLPEAIQSTTNEAVLGIQWHPEALMATDARHGIIFRHFVEHASMKAKRQ